MLKGKTVGSEVCLPAFGVGCTKANNWKTQNVYKTELLAGIPLLLVTLVQGAAIQTANG